MDNMTVGYTEPLFRVYNRCHYDIGVTVQDGKSYNIRPGSFALLTAHDIEYIESICQDRKFFATGMLEAVYNNGEKVELEKLSIVEAPKEEKALIEDEIIEMLKKPLKTFTNWLDAIEDPVELHAIYKTAITLDLPASKLKVLNAKMPNKDWLEEMD